MIACRHLVILVGLAACSGGATRTASTTHDDATAAPRGPQPGPAGGAVALSAAPTPVTLPTVPAAQVWPVQAAAGFVTIDGGGLIHYGRLAAGGAPYASAQPLGPGSLEQGLAEAGLPTAADAPIDTGLADGDASQVTAAGTRTRTGSTEVLVLAASTAPAATAVAVLSRLPARTAGLAVATDGAAGPGAPGAIGYRFAATARADAAAGAIQAVLDGGEARLSLPDGTTHPVRATVDAPVRAALRGATVVVRVEAAATVQQLSALLGRLSELEVATVALSAPTPAAPPRFGTGR